MDEQRALVDSLLGADRDGVGLDFFLDFFFFFFSFFLFHYLFFFSHLSISRLQKKALCRSVFPTSKKEK